MGYSINPKWLSDLSKAPEDVKQRRRDLVLGSGAVFEVLTSILKTEVEELSKPQPSDAYDKAGWAYKEADRQGQVRFVRKMLELMNRTETNA